MTDRPAAETPDPAPQPAGGPQAEPVPAGAIADAKKPSGPTVRGSDTGTFVGVYPDEGRPLYNFAKRVFDIAFSGCAIVVLFVPSVVLSAAICIESPGAPIYCQRRLGRVRKDGTLQQFTMLKFRSMCKDADAQLAKLQDRNEADGPLFKIADDPRVTRIGRFIRKHSIDEFPQFVNVFLGQMSVVGPRPPLPGEVEQYSERDLGRLRVKPGLTGPWQVSGRSDLTFDDMVRLDLEYIDTRSFRGDLAYIWRTIKVVLDGDGAY